MKLYYIQHVFFETPAGILDWAKEKNWKIFPILAYENQIKKINIQDCDVLLIMGGPMGVYDENIYPWLKEEKKILEQAITLHKKVIGICLGAQLIANVLGANVYKNPYREIGWFPINSTEYAKKIFSLSDSFIVFHWHGDTFDLPDGAIHLFYNEATLNQGFLWSNYVLGLQFHLEMKPENIELLYKHSYSDIKNAKDKKYIKENNPEENTLYFLNSNKLLYKILDSFIYNL